MNFSSINSQIITMINEENRSKNAIKSLIKRANTAEAKRGVQIANELSDMILFHTKVYENGKRMERPWEDD